MLRNLKASKKVSGFIFVFTKFVIGKFIDKDF